ncbi:hypothetical protein NEMIN01_0357 [Nematocida minor]|uniref:uncharacterized protein n=1 Tax=Nematocida minor TaxID=1912983 RepID=UPI00221FF6C0|nr:uncharacterized protein NEMIN01_0357 [Nematocida minor]KAI5189191.1 hypothetical protein NEMIN01_0357 [Nematocida minor]
MILQRALKQVAVGVFALAYLQSASCLTEKEVLTIKDYWAKKLECMKTEFRIRSDFLSKVRTFKCKEIPSAVIKEDIEIGLCNLSSIQLELLAFNQAVKEIKSGVKAIMSLNIQGTWPFKHPSTNIPPLELKAAYDNFEKMLPPVLYMGDSVIIEIKKFDSHMLETIEKYSRMKDNNTKIQEMTLFKLAKNDKPLAVDLLYAFFKIDESIPKKHKMKKALDYISKKIGNYVFAMDFSIYINTIKESIEKGDLDLLKLANNNIHLLFNAYGSTAEATDIYLRLMEEKVPVADLEKCMNITPGQAMKVIMIECAFTMSGSLMDYRRNSLLSNLGKIIAEVGRPDKRKENTEEDGKIAKKRQDEILDALDILWNDLDMPKTEIETKNIKRFLSKNRIDNCDFKTTQDSFLSVKWMYTLNDFTATPDKLTNSEHTFFKEMHFDMAYTHPMPYIYQRCEDMSNLVKKDLEPNARPFISISPQGITLRPYRVSKEDEDSTHEKNVKECIKAWFLGFVVLISREEDGQEYYDDVVKVFEKHLKKSQGIFGVKILPEKKANSEKNEIAALDN